MNNDSSPGQDLCEKQKAWNAQYYGFLDVFLKSANNYTQLYPSIIEDIEEKIRKGHTRDALALLKTVRESLADHFKREAEMIQKHHEYLGQAMGNYQAMVEAMRDYASAKNDEDITQIAENQLRGVEDFTLAAIAYLDPDPA